MERDEMRRHRLPLDDTTADRLADGELDPADAPPGYTEVARLLAEVNQHDLVTELDERLLGSLLFAITTEPTTDRVTPVRTRFTAKVGAVAAGALLVTAGAAAAATGNLPDPAQEAMADVAGRVGIDLPNPGDDDGDEPVADDGTGTGGGTEDDGTGTGEAEGDGTGTRTGDAEGDGAERTTGNVDNPTDADAHGVEVSDVARTTEATGRDKGAEVSETARAGHGPSDGTEDEDDDEGDDAEAPGRPEQPGSQAPVDHPSGPSAAGGPGAGAGGGPGVDVGRAGSPSP